ncbi:MAG TPA: alpha/beta hydrolase family protein [Chitinophagaceae bacterium]|nr:alpha/beta hydrolase family protein [Chitinophagaceae bacterium]
MKKFLLFLAALACSGSLLAATVDTIQVFSLAMNKNIPCVIILPDSYHSTGKRFPVVYLLHGYSGSYANWSELAPQLHEEADQYNMILVCPDGGYNSWYFDSPVNPAIRYETFVAGELIAYLDSHYRTRADRRHRAITGLSMGGHGALYLAIRHRSLYGAAGSTSGGVDIRPFPGKWDIRDVLGDTSCCRSNWENNTVINLADSLRPGDLQLIFDCGVDDFFLEVNRQLHRKLLEHKIDHDYTERPGGHTAAYWRNSIDYQLLFFRKYFQAGEGVAEKAGQ